ncbi:MAG: hypothetical protein AB7K52_00655 [Phycisphaerales bacterium]
MGLTRFWYRPPSLDADTFGEWAADCRAIIATASLPAGFRPTLDNIVPRGRIIVRGPEGKGDPVVTDGTIALNGDASAGQEHEPFQVERDTTLRPHRRLDDAGRIFEYCKTAGKPYDAVVDACLIALRKRFGSLVSVEEDAEAKPLVAGKQLYAEAFGPE